ncbi:MAG: RDD family protein [Plesiomonas sp.]
MAVMSASGHARAGFFRRVGAFIYDLLLSLAVVMVAGAIAVGCTALLAKTGAIQIPVNMDVAAYLDSQSMYSFYLLGCFCWFYVGFWQRSGQTLGMRAWRLRVQQLDGRNLTFTQATVRLVTATVGFGNLVVLFDRGNLRAFQDYMADCEVVVLGKDENLSLLGKRKTQ